MMDSNAQRRVDCLYRHFIQEPRPLSRLHMVPLGAQTEAENEEPVLMGGMILDIHAIPFSSVLPKTTTPGKVNYMLGGVARNIAECMLKLSSKPFLISALGTDMAGQLLLQNWISTGLSIAGIRMGKNIETPVICNVFDTKGELAAAVASVHSIERFLDAKWVHHCENKIRTAPILMADANLSPLALEACCQVASKHGVPVWFEPVSVAKSKRIASIAHLVTIASPNVEELISMANALSNVEASPPFKPPAENISLQTLLHKCKHPVSILLNKGIKVIALTLGENGVFLCCKGREWTEYGLERAKGLPLNSPFSPLSRVSKGAKSCVNDSEVVIAHFPALPTAVVRLTGAGDCFVGGALWGLCSGLDVMQSAAVGVAAAKGAVEGESNVPFCFDLGAVADDAMLVYSKVRLM